MKKLSVIVLAAIVVIGAIWFMRATSADYPPALASSNASQSPAQSPAAPTARIVGSRPILNPAFSGRKLALALPSKSALLLEYENALSLREFVEKYAIDSAAPEAKFLAAKIMIDDCRSFGFATPRWRENALKRTKDGAPTRKAQLAAIALVENKCGGDWTRVPPATARAHELMNSAIEAGNSAAAAYLLANNVSTKPCAELADRVGQYLASNDLLTIEQAMRAILTVGQQIGTMPLDDGASANPFLFTHAAMLAMCDLGKDCGPQSLYVLGACAVGFCNIGSLEDYVRLHSSTPSDFQEIMRLRQLIVNSVLSGNKKNLGWDIFSLIKD